MLFDCVWLCGERPQNNVRLCMAMWRQAAECCSIVFGYVVTARRMLFDCVWLCGDRPHNVVRLCMVMW